MLNDISSVKKYKKYVSKNWNSFIEDSSFIITFYLGHFLLFLFPLSLTDGALPLSLERHYLKYTMRQNTGIIN